MSKYSVIVSIVCTPQPAKKKKKQRGKGEGGESPTKFKKKKGGGWVAGKERGCSFYIKNKLKSEIFNYKKVYI